MKLCKRDRLAEERKHASAEDFRQVFTNGRDRLYQLAFLLAGDQKLAERIYVSSLDDSMKSTGISKDWAQNWAKHTVIQNAIRMVNPQPREDTSYYSVAAVPRTGELFNVRSRELIPDRILELDDFDRFVVVITILERYSDHDCALLLSAFLRDVRHSRIRAMQEIAGVESAQHEVAGPQLQIQAL